MKQKPGEIFTEVEQSLAAAGAGTTGNLHLRSNPVAECDAHGLTSSVTQGDNNTYTFVPGNNSYVNTPWSQSLIRDPVTGADASSLNLNKSFSGTRCRNGHILYRIVKRTALHHGPHSLITKRKSHVAITSIRRYKAPVSPESTPDERQIPVQQLPYAPGRSHSGAEHRS